MRGGIARARMRKKPRFIELNGPSGRPVEEALTALGKR
jgi:hypothetical protein